MTRFLGCLLLTITACAQTKPGFVIAGTVVEASGGEPIAKATVTIALSVISSGEREPPVTTTTGDDGHFRFDALKPGKYHLTGKKRGYPWQGLDEHDGFTTAVVVGPDLVSGGLVLRLHREALLSGRVTDDQGDAVRNAQVYLFRTSNETGQPAPSYHSVAQTDDQGAYKFWHQMPGKYLLAVAAQPWYAQNQPRPSGTSEVSPLDVVFPLTFYAGAIDPASASPIALSWGDSATANVILQAVPALHLHVRTPASDPPSDRSQPTQPQPGIGVNVVRRVLGVQVQGGVTSSSVAGMTEIGGLAPGQYDLTIQTYGPNPAVSRLEVDTSRDAEIDATKFREMVAVTGTVQLDGAKTPAAGTNVNLRDVKTSQWFSAQVSATGEFDFTQKLAPGKYEVIVNGGADSFLKSVEGSGARIAGFEIEIGAEPVKLKLTASQGFGEVSGVAMRDGKPLGGAMVVLVPASRRLDDYRRDQSDSDGTFTLPRAVTGSYTVIALQNWDVAWQDPEVLKRSLPLGQTVRVEPKGKYNIKVEVQ